MPASSKDQTAGDIAMDSDAKQLPPSIRARLAKIIADKGVNTKMEENGATMLHYAVANGEIETIKLLMEQKGIDLNPITITKKHSPLHVAAIECEGSAASTLLDHTDTDATLQNVDEKTAYEIALDKECANPDAYKR